VAQERAKKAKEAAEKEQTWFEPKVNTSVYVTGLPSDVTEAELAQVCSLLSCETEVVLGISRS
jgi:hypothetical protein